MSRQSHADMFKQYPLVMDFLFHRVLNFSSALAGESLCRKYDFIQLPVISHIVGLLGAAMCWTNQIPTGTVAVVDAILQL